MRVSLCLRSGAILALALAGAGCIRVEQTLTLNADGTGIIDLTYGMREEQIGPLQETARSLLAGEAGADAEAMPFDFSDADVRRDFKEFEADGVFLDSVQTTTREGWRFRRLVIRFKSLAALARTGFLADRHVSLTRDARGNYSFVQSSNGGNGTGAFSALAAMPADGGFQEVLDGFRAVIRVRTPGRILRTNSPERSDRTAAWTFDLEQDPDALEKAQQAAMQIVFDGSGLSIPEFRTPPGTPRG